MPEGRMPNVLTNSGYPLSRIGLGTAVFGNDGPEPMRARRTILATRRPATAWSLAWTGISAIAVDARCPEHIDAVAEAPAIGLSVRDVSDIANLLPDLDGDRGPGHPRRFAKTA
ncbi:MAG: hypothetical protein H6Q99_1649 [Proteobacteria bacterium]|nr:hypothetical protein [Pseudomonadota bacterium]